MLETASPLDRARAALETHFGYPDFRPLQRRVIHAVLSGHDTLAILPTGGGKSICFQIPAVCRSGLTIVISPLIALMQDQVDAACERGMSAATLHSGMPVADQRAVRSRLEAGDPSLQLLYLSPERLNTLIKNTPDLLKPSLLAIDEAHCISEWGPDFRPTYRVLRRLRRALGWPQTVALTGSATPAVRADIIQTLGLGGGFPRRRLVTHLGSFDRANLWFGTVAVKDPRERLGTLLHLLRGKDRIALVYAPTRGMTEGIARKLRNAGYLAAPYHAGLPSDLRARTLADFLEDRLEVVVATSAFGMGIDKPNVRMVVHWQMPPTPEAYYQEAGRAGRDGRFARCVLLHHADDGDQARRMLQVTFPPRDLVEAIARDPARRRGVPENVLDSADRIARELGLPHRPGDWSRILRRRKEAEGRIRAMEEYARHPGCRRQKLLAWFGERVSSCSGCDRCRSVRPRVPVTGPDREVVDRVYQRLVAWREEVSRGGGLPVDSIVSDAALGGIAAACPVSRQALGQVEGVGPRILAKFGEQILRMCEEEGGGAGMGSSPPPARPPAAGRRPRP